MSDTPETSPPTARIRDQALRLLARREHSVCELRAKLARRGQDGGAVDAVLAELVAEGLLSDARFAEAYVRARVDRGYGPLRIRAELAERGVAEPLVQAALAAAEVDWAALAARVRQRRFGAAPPRDWPERARQMRFLQGRGYPQSLVRACVEADANTGEHP